MTIWIMIAIIGVGTYLLRFSFLSISKPSYPKAVAKALRFVPVTVLAALAAPKIFIVEGQFAFLANPFIIPAVLAGLIAWYTKHLGFTIAVGLLSYWTLSWMLGF